MKDIGYSGQYLDNKEFRLKFRTGGDILNATGDAIAGEILVQTGVSPAVYIATETSTLDTSSIFKIADLTEKVGVVPAAPASTTPVEYEAIEAAYDDLTKPKILELEIVEQEGFFGDLEKAIRFVILDKRQIPASADLDISIGPGNGTYDGGESLPLAGTFSADLDFGYTKEGSIYKGTAATNSFSPDSSLEDIKCFFKENNSAIGGFSDIVQMDVDNLGEIYQYPYTNYTLSDGTIIPAADKFKIISTSVATSAILDTFVFEKSLDFKTPLNQNRSSTGLPLFIGPQHTYDNGGDGLLEGVNSQSWLEPVSFDSTNQTAVYKLRGVEYRPNTSPTYLPYAYGGLSEEFTIDFSDLVFFSNPSFPIAGFDLQEVVS